MTSPKDGPLRGEATELLAGNVRVEGHLVCSATHPDWPNYEGHSRGRKLHLFATDQDKFGYPATFCGMLAVKFYPVNEFYPSKNICTQCTTISAKEALQ